jgi:hypothetical protein
MVAQRLVATAALWPFREHDGDINLEDDPACLDDLVERVRTHGITDPLVLNITADLVGGGRRASVWDGNHHLVAARRLGIEQVPVVIRHNLASRFPGHPYHGEFDQPASGRRARPPARTLTALPRHNCHSHMSC